MPDHASPPSCRKTASSLRPTPKVYTYWANDLEALACSLGTLYRRPDGRDGIDCITGVSIPSNGSPLPKYPGLIH